MALKISTFCIAAFFLVLANISNGLAQVEEESNKTVILKDTIELNDQALIGTDQKDKDLSPDSVIVFSDRNQKKIPHKAALYAAALPGLGQIYNGSVWKLPIVYGTFITLGWVATWHHDRYLLFRRANIAEENDLPEENPLNGLRFNISSGVEQTRRDRDFTYILMAGAYALQIMEAIVDAHLIEFDVSEELSMDMQPSVGQFLTYAGGGGNFVPAFGFSLKLKIQ
ncbi:hypothetical protein OKW21_001993 [Catalinimonas alkaloidigena]|uniref:DUF5683 domain-containing protein n=1 Tax=Catalinimonas alkaloidigena TaxID=1075417 RepID=UPI002406F005|nr:DUF5683 domain-containing protein [Catalinimonas alkaloidigena]MDF9796730.1 hypothetical protein [Catalinimonas alkaloidigena]